MNHPLVRTIVVLSVFLFVHCFEVGFIKERQRARAVAEKPARPAVAPARDEDTTATVVVSDTLPADIAALPQPLWQGRRFWLLEKNRLFQQYGYELYTSPRFSDEKAPADTAVAHPNHRIKYDPFKATAVTVTDVERLESGEYRIRFKTDTLGLTVYGKTRMGIIEGIALESDYSAAQKRFEGTTVFSRRRSIDIYDSVHSRFQSAKVSVAEPLEVFALRWGITPLPPKSLWLIVRRQNGSGGFIPINYSWTNVLRTEETTLLPWENEILEKNPKQTYAWDDRTWEIIDNHNIFTRMTTDQVRLSWGEPVSSSTNAGSDGNTVTVYFYKGKKLTFINDSLSVSADIDATRDNR